MKLLVTGISALLAVSLLTPAEAVCPGNGGNDETSENFSAAGGNWTTAAPTPGTVAGGLSSPDLLITEVCYTPNQAEFVEIYNPTANTISLDGYYLSDDASVTGPTGYWRIVLGLGYTIAGGTVDWNVKFPAGASIAAGATKVIYMGAAAGAAFSLGTADYEVANSTATPDMVPIANTPSPAAGLLTNGSATNGEPVILYKWDGVCDLVCDVDYMGCGNNAAPTAAHRINKSGIAIDGIDGDAIASIYANDTPIASQSLGQVHVTSPAQTTIQRIGVGTHAANGNGCMILIVPVEESTWGKIKTLYQN